VIENLAKDRFHFRFVGPIAGDARGIAARLANRSDFKAKVPQRALPEEYEWGDVFVLPTLQDGFAVVLTQALAAGLPLITSTNCAGPDLIKSGVNGWVVPIRSPETLAERLHWLDQHRQELSVAVMNTYDSPQHWDWSETAKQAENNISEGLKAREVLLSGKPNGF
jgi:glycosyltransferase involved in cell wall biosynthesis